eukprot:TRINITY_DN31295_c0_g1_i1.p1 TRINITY_DN31295_c0_g1~~TRINITY_DN31295_c0_g1_i1.p1  ORF type:complete len:427 (+),score=42.41 TRINITY_DN31295_c0_g1_i1:151-1281(+)
MRHLGLDEVQALRFRDSEFISTPGMTSAPVDHFVNHTSPSVAHKISSLDGAQNRHHVQHRQLMEAFFKHGLFSSEAALWIEFGCGKAGLTRWVAGACAAMCKTSDSFILVEREPRRSKTERSTDVPDMCKANMLRLRMDLKDFDVQALVQKLCSCTSEAAVMSQGCSTSPVLSDPSIPSILLQRTRLTAEEARLLGQPRMKQLEKAHLHVERLGSTLGLGKTHAAVFDLIFHAKHLCGSATDVALYSLERAVEVPVMGTVLRRKVGIATCCHHRCTWDTYVGKGFLSTICPEEVSVRRVFDILVRTSSWANLVDQSSKRRLFGMRAKRILDAGRLWYMREHLGLENSRAYAYTERRVSPENILLIGGGSLTPPDCS